MFNGPHCSLIKILKATGLKSSPASPYAGFIKFQNLRFRHFAVGNSINTFASLAISEIATLWNLAKGSFASMVYLLSPTAISNKSWANTSSMTTPTLSFSLMATTCFPAISSPLSPAILSIVQVWPLRLLTLRLLLKNLPDRRIRHEKPVFFIIKSAKSILEIKR